MGEGPRRRALSFLLFIACIWLSVALSRSQGTTSSPDDVAVMRKLATLLSPPGWSAQGDPCKPAWRFVNCEDGRVVSINLASKGLTGSLPGDLNKLSNLRVLQLQRNAIKGPLPSLAKLSNLQELYLDGNHFTFIPPDFFSGLTSLQSLSLDDNSFAPWTIPNDLTQSTNLADFSASNASISGSIPSFLGELPNLQSLRLSYNNLTGELPASFASSNIQSLILNNQLSATKLAGSLDVLSSMTQITQVWLHANSFTGPIPDLSKCDSLFDLQLRDNVLTGVVSSVFSLGSLKNISLGNNLLQGPFPTFADGIKVDADRMTNNKFCNPKPGPCDPRVMVLLSVAQGFGYPAKLATAWEGNDPCNSWTFVSCDPKGNIIGLTLGKQNLSGTISPDIANITTLTRLFLNDNSLTGPVPDSLTHLTRLQTLDASNNNLSGRIPAFEDHVSLNLSGNPLIGKELPSGGGGSGSGATNGDVLPDGSGNKTSSFATKWIIMIVIIAVFVVVVVSILIYVRKRMKSRGDQSPLIKPRVGKIEVASSNGNGALISEPTSHGSSGHTDVQVVESGRMIFSIHVLRRVTNNFSEDYVVGRGGFGVVYKGVLQDGTQIAIKRMESSVVSSKGLTEFQSEIDVLTKVRHRHLVSLTGHCAEANERLLVYEYMPQGTLGQHLFEWRELGYEPLTWKQRITIALDVARGVEYLHSLAQTCFIHRDLKPSNILLTDDMRGKVSDFGLVKLAPDGKFSVETRLAGTFGYLAPEYCATGRVTTKADVYSFGVILMEIIAGRKVLDESQPDERTHLVTWLRRVMINKENMLKALDPSLNPDEETFASICTVAELAGHCTARDPFQRPDMGHAVNTLAPLVEQWRPTSPAHEDDDGGSSSFHMSLSQAVERWQANEGTSLTGDLLYSRAGNSQTSMEPSAFPHSFASNNAR
ncbi:receptor-like kinase TMK4 [Aristolochia californica]|uniref:receptor-like kinase TMK4 n=1 Tax=Aristolochia californica TaxID=171875 RepID=UPI0035DBCB5F